MLIFFVSWILNTVCGIKSLLTKIIKSFYSLILKLFFLEATYDEWAETYDHDLKTIGYPGPLNTVQIVK